MAIQIVVDTTEAAASVGSLAATVGTLKVSLRAAYAEGIKLGALSFDKGAEAQLLAMREEVVSLKSALLSLKTEMAGLASAGTGIVASSQAQAVAFLSTAQALDVQAKELAKTKIATKELTLAATEQAAAVKLAAAEQSAAIIAAANAAKLAAAEQTAAIKIAAAEQAATIRAVAAEQAASIRAAAEESRATAKLANAEKTADIKAAALAQTASMRAAAAEQDAIIKASAAEQAASIKAAAVEQTVSIKAAAAEQAASVKASAAEQVAANRATADAAKASNEVVAGSMQRLSGLFNETSSAAGIYQKRLADLSIQAQIFAESEGKAGFSAEKMAAGMATAAAELRTLSTAEVTAGVTTGELAAEMGIANQASAAFRASLEGSGLGFGIFTGATILAATAAFAMAKSIKDTIVAGAEFEQSTVRGAVFAGDYKTSLDAMGNSLTTVGGQTRLLTTAAQELATTSRFSSQEFLDGAAKLQQASVSLIDTYSTLQAVSNLATISNSGLVESTADLIRVNHLFGLSFQDSESTVSKLAVGITSAQTTIQSITKSLEYVGPVARQAGLDLGQTVAAIATLNKAGIESDKAGTSLTALFNTLGKQTPAATKALADLGRATNGVALTFHDFWTKDGLDFVGMIDKIGQGLEHLSKEDQLTKLTAIFRQRGAPGATFLIQNIADLVKFNDEMKVSADKAQKLADALNNTTEVAFKEFGNEIKNIEQNAFKDFGSGLYTSLKQITTFLKDNAVQISQTISSALTSLLTMTKFVVEHIGAITTLIEAYAAFKVTMIVATSAMAAYVSIMGIVRATQAAFAAQTLVVTETLALETSGIVAAGSAAALATPAMEAMGVAGKAALLGIGGITTLVVAGLAAVAYGAYTVYQNLNPIPQSLADINAQLATFDSASKSLGRMNLDALKNLGVQETETLKQLNAQLVITQTNLDKYIGTQKLIAIAEDVALRLNPWALVAVYTIKATDSVIAFGTAVNTSIASFFKGNVVIEWWTSLNTKINEVLDKLGQYILTAGKAVAIFSFGSIGSGYEPASDPKVKVIKEEADAATLAIQRLNEQKLDRLAAETVKTSDAFNRQLSEAAKTKEGLKEFSDEINKGERYLKVFQRALIQTGIDFTLLNVSTKAAKEILESMAAVVAATQEAKKKSENETAASKAAEDAKALAGELKTVLSSYEKLNYSPDILIHSLDRLNEMSAALNNSASAASLELRKLGVDRAFADKAIEAAAVKDTFEQLKLGLTALNPAFSKLKQGSDDSTVAANAMAKSYELVDKTVALATKTFPAAAEQIKQMGEDAKASMAGLADGSTELKHKFEELGKTAPEAFNKLLAKQEDVDTFARSMLGLNAVLTPAQELTSALALAAKDYASVFKNTGTEIDKQNAFMSVYNTLLDGTTLGLERGAKALKNYHDSTPTGAIEKTNENLKNQIFLLENGVKDLTLYNELWKATKGDLGLVTEAMRNAAIAQEKLSENLKQVEQIQSMYKSLADGLTGVFKNVFEGVDKSFSSIVGDIKNQFKQLLESMVLAAIKNQILFSMGFTSQGGGASFLNTALNGAGSLFGDNSAPASTGGTGNTVNFDTQLAAALQNNYGISPTSAGTAPAASSLGGTNLLSLVGNGGGSGNGASPGVANFSGNDFLGLMNSGKSVFGFFSGSGISIPSSPTWGVAAAGSSLGGLNAGGSVAEAYAGGYAPNFGAGYSSLTSTGGGGAGTGASAGGGAGGSIMPIVGGVLAGLSEYKAAGGGAGGLAGAAAYGIGTYSLGIAATAAIAAGTAAVGGGIAAGAAAGMAAIGPVGWIALAAMAINIVSGGKLFGTAYKPTGGATTYDISQTGGTLTSQTFESKEKAFFGGKAYKTINNAVSPADQAQAEKMYQAIVQAGMEAQNKLGITLEGIVSGSFKTLYDKKGKMTDQLSTVLGVIYHESIDDFNTRMQAEQVVSAVGGSIAATGGNADEANQIAQQYRANANTLKDAAATMLTAQLDIKNGSGLLQQQGAGVLTKTMQIVSDLNTPGEALAATYARLVSSTTLMTSVFNVMGTAVTKGREDFVRFSAAVVQDLGGVDAATKAWKDFSESVYSFSQQLVKPVSNTNLTGALSKIGVSSDTTIADFAAKFQAALPTLSSSQLADWIKAGGALGAINNSLKLMDGLAKGVDLSALIGQQESLVKQLNDLITAAAAAGASQEQLAKLESDGKKVIADQLVKFMTPVQDALDKLTGNTAASQLRAIQQQFDTNTLSAKQLGASTQDLAAIQALATYQTIALIGQVTNSIIAPTANSNLTGSLAKIGLAPDTSQADFNAQFKAKLPTMSQEDLGNWLKAGGALSSINNSIAVMSGLAKGVDLSSIISQQSTLITQLNNLILAAAAAGASQQQLAQMEKDANEIIKQQLVKFMSPIQDALAKITGNDLAFQFQQIQQQFAANTLGAKQLGAATKDLAEIQQLAMYQTMALIGQFTGSIVNPKANGNLASSLSKIGLGADTTQGQFNAEFQKNLPQMSDAQVAAWITAGSALATINNSMGIMAGLAKGVDLTSVITQQRAFVGQLNGLIIAAAAAGASQEQLAKMEEQAAQAIQQKLTSFMNPIEQALAAFTGRDYTYQLQQIQDQFNSNTLSAEALGASTQQLADIQSLAAYQTAQVIGKLQASLTGLVSKLYGADSAASQASNSAQSASTAQSQAQTDLYNQKMALYTAEHDAIKTITDFLKQSLVNALSPLSWQGQLDTAKQQFEAEVIAAKGGDINAIKDVTQYAQTYLQHAQSAYGNSADYATIYAFVTQSLQGLSSVFKDAVSPGAAPGSGSSSSGGSSSSSTTSISAADRYQLAIQFAQQIGELGLALNVSVFDLMKQYGVSMEQLMADLHINLTNMDDNTVTNLKVLNGGLGTKMIDLLAQLKVTPESIGKYFKTSADQINAGNLNGVKELSQFLGVDIFTAMKYLGGSIQDMAKSLGLNITKLDTNSVDNLLAIAKTLGVSSADLIKALGVSYTDLAKSFGISISGFNASMVSTFVTFATKLGLNIVDAATSIGLNISTLSTAIVTSVNSGLQTLPNLPKSFTDGVQPYLTEIANAKTPEDLKKAYSDMNLYLSTLPASLLALIGPLFTSLGFSLTKGDGGTKDIVTQQTQTNVKLDQTKAAITDGFSAIAPPIISMGIKFDTPMSVVNTSILSGYTTLGLILAQLVKNAPPAIAGAESAAQAVIASKVQSDAMAAATKTAADRLFSTMQQQVDTQATQSNQTNNTNIAEARKLQAKIDQLTAVVGNGLGKVAQVQGTTATAVDKLHTTTRNQKQNNGFKK